MWKDSTKITLYQEHKQMEMAGINCSTQGVHEADKIVHMWKPKDKDENHVEPFPTSRFLHQESNY